jgi:hypothetical protein
MRNAYKISAVKSEGQRPTEILGYRQRTILKRILKEWDIRVWAGSPGSDKIQWKALVNTVTNLSCSLKGRTVS